MRDLNPVSVSAMGPSKIHTSGRTHGSGHHLSTALFLYLKMMLRRQLKNLPR